MPVHRSPSRDPFPEAVDVALAEAVLLTAPPDRDAGVDDIIDGLHPEDLASMWRDVDAVLLVEQTVPTPEWDDARLVDALAANERTARAVAARGLRLAGELAARRPGTSDDPAEAGLSKYAVDEVALATGLARGAARRRVADAQAIVARHPRLLDALEAGLVSPPGLHRVVELCWELGTESARRIDAAVVTELGRPFVAGLGRMPLADLLALDPLVARSITARATTLRLSRLAKDAIAVQRPRRERNLAAREQRSRRVALDLAAGGMAWLSIYVRQELAVAAYEKVSGLARTLDDPTDDRTLDNKRADVAIDLVLGTGDHVPGSAGGDFESQTPAAGWGTTAVSLDVIVDHTRCPGPDGLGGRAGSGAGCVGEAGRLGPVTVDSLAALLGLTMDSGGTVSGGHAVETPCPGPDGHRRSGPGPYEPGEPLRRFVRATWRRCVFPGCSRPARRCELDHTKRYRDGGPTCRCNLRPLCKHHHLLKHHTTAGRAPWRLITDGDVLTWVSPTGLAVPVAPDPPDEDRSVPQPGAHDPPPY